MLNGRDRAGPARVVDRAALRHRHGGRRGGLDRGGAAGAELGRHHPRNGHAHLIYLLGGWVRTDFGDPSRLKVVRYAAAIERAYATAFGADTAYSGRFHHNPLSAAYVTKVGRDAPYSLAELAQYVDLATPATKRPPVGLGRNVEVFDRLRRWAYTAIADWRIGTDHAWHEAVARRAAQIAADVGAASPRGPLKQNEVGHIVKSVARWVWERYVAGVPPLLREARIAAQREQERDRLKAREAARERSRMTRDEYIPPRPDSAAQRPRKCVARACRYARSRRRYGVRSPRFSGCSQRLYRVRPAY